MNKVFFLIIIVLCSCSDLSNSKSKQSNKNIDFQAVRQDSLLSESLFNPFLHNWFISVRDSMTFEVTFKIKDNTLAMTYANVLYNGDILNAEFDSLDYASIIQPMSIKDNQINCYVKNYYGGEIYKLKLSLNRTGNKLLWEIIDFKDEPQYLPVRVSLTKQE
jgi:hypothetical protein